MKATLIMSVALCLASGICFAEDREKKLASWFDGSKLIVRGTIMSEPHGALSHFESAEYRFPFKVADVFKGDEALTNEIISVKIIHFDKKFYNPLLKKDEQGVLFLRREGELWKSAHFAYHMQPPTPWLIKSLTTLEETERLQEKKRSEQLAADAMQLTTNALIGVWLMDWPYIADTLVLGTNGTAKCAPQVGAFPVTWSISSNNTLRIESIALTNSPPQLLYEGLLMSPKTLRMGGQRHGRPFTKMWHRIATNDQVNTFLPKIPITKQTPQMYRQFVESRAIKRNANKTNGE